jgi:hypothetical protein
VVRLRGRLAGEESAWWGSYPVGGGQANQGSSRSAGRRCGPTPWQSLPSAFPHISTSLGLQVCQYSVPVACWLRPGDSGLHHPPLPARGLQRLCNQEVWWPGDSVGLSPAVTWGSEYSVWGGEKGCSWDLTAGSVGRREGQGSSYVPEKLVGNSGGRGPVCELGKTLGVRGLCWTSETDRSEIL